MNDVEIEELKLSLKARQSFFYDKDIACFLDLLEGKQFLEAHWKALPVAVICGTSVYSIKCSHCGAIAQEGQLTAFCSNCGYRMIDVDEEQ